MKKAKKPVLNLAWCKGCGVCSAFCPKAVLSLKGDKIAIVNADACIGCGLCEVRCPDYAIWMEEVDAK